MESRSRRWESPLLTFPGILIRTNVIGNSWSVQIKAEYNQTREIATAFGVRLLGTALVVNCGSAAMTWKEPTSPFVSEICRIRDDYQSGSKQPHSKGSADLCRAFK